jgi:CHAT domain-containing protein
MRRLAELTLSVLSAVASPLCAAHDRTTAPLACPTRGCRELAVAAADLRPFRPRLSNLGCWAECGRPVAGLSGIPVASCVQSRSGQLAKLRAAGRQIEREARVRPGTGTSYALGLWSLLQPQNGQRLDSATLHLAEAAGETPASGPVWNDLAVAYFARAEVRQRPEDLIQSLAACDRALRAAPGLRPALFNRALVLEALFLRAESALAWRKFLGVADSPEWAAEARAHMVATRVPATTRSHSLLDRLAAGTHLLPVDLAETVAAEPVEALDRAERFLLGGSGPSTIEETRLESARAIAAELARCCGDRLLGEEVAEWAKARGSQQRAAQLSAGYACYREARRLYDDLDTQRAGALFEEAARNLSMAGSPLHLWASYYLAVCQYWAGNLPAAAAQFAALRDAARADYPLLRGHASWMLGLITASESDFDSAWELYRDALAAFERGRAIEQGGYVRVLYSDLLWILNDPHAAWEHLYCALAQAQSWHSAKWRYSFFDEIAARSRALGEPEAALYFEQRAIEAALAGGQPAVISEAYAQRALALHRAGQMASARFDAIEARRWLARITDPPARDQTEATVLLAEARLAGRANPQKAIASLTAAVRDRERRKITSRLPELQLECARLLRSAGEMAQAEKALRKAVAAIETGSRSLRAEQRRSAFFATAREAFDEMIRFQLDGRRDSRAALLFVERARLHEFLTAGVNRGRQVSGAGIEALAARLGKRGALLVYHVLDDRLLLWAVTTGGTTFRMQPLGARELSGLVDGLLQALRQPMARAAVESSAGRLYGYLISPVAATLPGVERLWIVPDGPLFQLPMGALFDTASGHFLAERYATVKSLTAGLEKDAQSPPRHQTAAPLTSILTVGDPAFDTTRFGALQRLPQARQEARDAAMPYPRREVLLDTAATRARFLAELGRQDVVHFAGHAVPNREAPDLSMLVLAPGKNEPGVLYGKDIERLALARLRLVVLSACDTTGGGSAAARGFSGLARPFLAAGVPVVIGSLWDVADRDSARFFSGFHRYLQNGRTDPGTALGKIQERELTAGHAAAHPTYTWAAFEAYVARPEPE